MADASLRRCERRPEALRKPEERWLGRSYQYVYKAIDNYGIWQVTTPLWKKKLISRGNVMLSCG